jgi:hypothetical protein
MVLKEILGLRGEWRKLHNEELHDVCTLCEWDHMKQNAMGWECGMYGKNRNVYRVLMGKLERKKKICKTLA